MVAVPKNGRANARMTNHVAPFAPIFSAKLFVADIDLLLIRPDKP